jgi:hypothetical protein
VYITAGQIRTLAQHAGFFVTGGNFTDDTPLLITHGHPAGVTDISAVVVGGTHFIEVDTNGFTIDSFNADEYPTPNNWTEAS